MAKSVFGNELLPPSGSLRVTDLERGDCGWTFRASGPDQERCPGCKQISNSRHSRYVRTLKDLPALGVPCRLRFASAVSDAGISGARSCFSLAPCPALLRF